MKILVLFAAFLLMATFRLIDAGGKKIICESCIENKGHMNIYIYIQIVDKM